MHHMYNIISDKSEEDPASVFVYEADHSKEKCQSHTANEEKENGLWHHIQNFR